MTETFPAIAERVFEMVENGQKTELRLRLGAPTKKVDDFACPIQILGIQKDRIFELFGVDSLQALQLALKFAATLCAQITLLDSPDLGLESF